MAFKEELAAAIAKALDMQDTQEILLSLEIPPSPDKGDFAYPCFRLAKTLKKSPQAIAQELAEKIEKPAFVVEIKTAAAYINFYIDRGMYAQSVLEPVLRQKRRYGSSDMGGGRNVVIDFSSPNIAKPFHIGHLRTTVIGAALRNIYNFLGYRSVGVNHLGDWGTQFGKLIVAYKNWGSKEAVERDGIAELTRIYIKFHDEAELNKGLEDEARNWLLKMEQGNEEALALWKWFYDISMIEFNRVYDRLGIEFEFLTGESFYNDKMSAAIDELREKGLLQESNGAQVVDLSEYNMPPCLILRSDGGTLYHTRDLATALYRKKEFDFVKAIYVVGLEQKLHFSQLFKVIEKMGYKWSKDMVHTPFGLVSLEAGRFSTRRGRVIRLEDLIEETVNKTMEVIKAKNPDLPNKEQVAEEVGIGAIKFNDMYNNRIKDVVFSWDRVLNFEGESGPYVQYTHARTSSLLSKSGLGENDLIDVDFSALDDDASTEVLKLIQAYPEKIVDASVKYEPFVITRHLVDIAQAFNKFYHDNPILNSEEPVRSARLALVLAVRYILSSGLGLLGIKAPEQM